MTISDVDASPVTILVKCSHCFETKAQHIIREDLEDYTLNDDKTYTSIQGECNDCLIKESEV